MKQPHLLILDEPTNHLDIDSRRALTDALNDYKGAVILVTHDRSLMEMVADRLWLVADGTIRPFDGDMDDYARHVLDSARGAQRKGETRKAAPRPPAVEPLRRKLRAAEEKLARESRQAAELDAALADPALHRDAARLAETTARRAQAHARLQAAEGEWIAAAQLFETAGGAT
jgi:ATP-binding cassette subfamily F protein 3